MRLAALVAVGMPRVGSRPCRRGTFLTSQQPSSPSGPVGDRAAPERPDGVEGRFRSHRMHGGGITSIARARGEDGTRPPFHLVLRLYSVRDAMTAYLSDDASKKAVHRRQRPRGRLARLRVALWAKRGITASRNQSMSTGPEGCPIAGQERQRREVGRRPSTNALGKVVGADIGKDHGW